MSVVEDATGEAGATGGVDQFQVCAWLDQAFAQLARSQWAEQLHVDGISVLEALRSECMVTLMRFSREGGAQVTRRHQGLRGFLVEQARRLGYRAKMLLKEARARGRAAPVQEARFVFFPTEPTHAQVLEPIRVELARRRESLGTFTSRPKLWDRMRGSDGRVSLTTACWPKEIGAARARGRAMAARLAPEAGVSLPPCEALGSEAGLLAHFRDLISTYLPTIVESLVIGRLLIERVRPAVIIVGNDVTLEGRVISYVARSAGVPTVTSQHGNVAGNPLHGRHIVDRVLVFGEASRRTMVEYGQQPDSLVVSGPTHLDLRPRQSGHPHEAVARQLELDPSRPFVLGLLSGARQFFSLPHHLQQIEALMRVSAARPEIDLVAKLHRVDLVGYYDQVRPQVPGNRVRVVPYAAPGYPVKIFDWLQGCRLVLTGASTAAVEAMLMDVPVITMDLCDELRAIDFIAAGATIHVRQLDEVLPAVQAVFESAPAAQEARRRAREYLVDCYGPPDGQAAARGADVIEALARSGGR